MAVRTYGEVRLSHDLDFWEITRLEPHVSIRLKQLFQGVSKSSVPPYEIPHNLSMDTDLRWFMSRYPLEISSQDQMVLDAGCDAFLARQAEMERILLPSYQHAGTVSLKDGVTIRPYQWQAIEILRNRKMLLVGDEVGLGKTIIAIGFFASVKESLPGVVVCDPHMQKQWQSKIEQFSNLKVHLIKKSTPYSLPPADIYVFRISQVGGWSDIFATKMFKSVIYDEPQSLRTGSSTEKGQACRVLSRNTEYRGGLSATPIYNYGDEMWHVMQFIDSKVLGCWEDFEREWCSPIGNGKYRIKNPKALGAYLREQYAMIRRVKSDVGLQLPKVSTVVEHIDYNQAAVDKVEELARQLAIKATTASFVERGNAARELDVMLRQTTGVAKAHAVATFVRMIVESGEPVILFGWHRECYDIWLKELKDLKPAMYTGSETATQKESEKNRFLNGDTDILIMSLRSGAGVDGLQYRCSTEVIGELDWSPGIHRQCIGRVDREGQKNPVTIFFLVVDDGSDPPMMDVLGLKASESQSIIDPSLEVTANQSDTSNLRKLVERYLSKKTSKK